MFEHVTIVVFLPLFISFLDPLGHLLEGGLEHGSELLTHLVDLSLQPRDLIDLLLLNDLVLRLQVVQVLVQLLDLGPVLVLLPLKLVALGYQLLEARLVLASHVRHDVPLPVLFVLQQLLQLQISVALLILRSLGLVGHLLLHDEFLSERLNLSLKNEVLLNGVGVGIVSLLLSPLLLSSFLLATHLFYSMNILSISNSHS